MQLLQLIFNGFTANQTEYVYREGRSQCFCYVGNLLGQFPRRCDDEYLFP